MDQTINKEHVLQELTSDSRRESLPSLNGRNQKIPTRAKKKKQKHATNTPAPEQAPLEDPKLLSQSAAEQATSSVAANPEGKDQAEIAKDKSPGACGVQLISCERTAHSLNKNQSLRALKRDLEISSQKTLSFLNRAGSYALARRQQAISNSSVSSISPGRK